MIVPKFQPLAHLKLWNLETYWKHVETNGKLRSGQFPYHSSASHMGHTWQLSRWCKSLAFNGIQEENSRKTGGKCVPNKVPNAKHTGIPCDSLGSFLGSLCPITPSFWGQCPSPHHTQGSPAILKPPLPAAEVEPSLLPQTSRSDCVPLPFETHPGWFDLPLSSTLRQLMRSEISKQPFSWQAKSQMLRESIIIHSEWWAKWIKYM